jgi:predicted DNA-binding transcriptional regulator AlpA
MNAETNLIRKFMEQNLELGKSHNDIIQELGISRATYYRHVKRIMDEDAKIWDKVHMDSAKYRAQRLVDSLLNCVNLCKQIMNDPKARPVDRIEAAKTLCISEAQIYKIVENGPTFKVSLPIYPNNHQELNNDNNTKQLPA